jgi:hypothetical protein
VPLTELSTAAPQSRDVWALGIRRAIPRAGERSWPSAAHGGNSPEQYGLLIFD